MIIDQCSSVIKIKFSTFCNQMLHKLTNDRWLSIDDLPSSETLLISFSVVKTIEAVSFAGSVNFGQVPGK